MSTDQDGLRRTELNISYFMIHPFVVAKFVQKVSTCATTFAQLVHNEEKIVGELLAHLQVEDSMALEPLLE